MSHRRLVLVSALTLADYLLWNSSLGGSGGAVAIVSGLTLVPLVLATASLLIVSAARILTDGRRTERRGVRRGTRRVGEPRIAPMRDGALRGDLAAQGSRSSAAAPPGKLAA